MAPGSYGCFSSGSRARAEAVYPNARASESADPIVDQLVNRGVNPSRAKKDVTDERSRQVGMGADLTQAVLNTESRLPLYLEMLAASSAR